MLMILVSFLCCTMKSENPKSGHLVPETVVTEPELAASEPVLQKMKLALKAREGDPNKVSKKPPKTT